MARVKFIKDEEPNIKALSSDKVLDGAIYVATDTGNMFLGMSDGTLLSIGGSDSIDTNTTYTLTKSGSNITLTGSDGSTYTVSDDNTTYSAGTGISMSGTTINNSGVRAVATGGTNGTISVNTNGTSANVAVKGLGSAAYTESSAYAASSHDHNRVTSKGTHAEIASGTTANAPTTGMADATAGMYMTQNYQDSNTPASYGNIINLVGAGTGQLMAEWSGNDSTTGHLYYRSHRDTSTGGWGSWNTIIDSANIGSQSVNYANAAGSATSATTATQLSTSAGSATQPIYFSSGKPVACTYSLNKTVPSNAVFTDTTDAVVVSSTQPTSSTCKLWIIP